MYGGCCLLVGAPDDSARLAMAVGKTLTEAQQMCVMAGAPTMTYAAYVLQQPLFVRAGKCHQRAHID
jgi:hypothetical protein